MQSSIISKDVVKALQSGMDWAFKIVFETYNARIFGMALKMGLTREDAEGVLQEVFIDIWDQRKTLKPELSFNALIFTIARRKVLATIRRNIARNGKEANLKYMTAVSSTETEDYVIFKEMISEARERIEQLPKRQQQIFMLSREHGLTNDEIAAKLSISKRTVENQLFRVTKELKASLQLNQKRNNSGSNE